MLLRDLVITVSETMRQEIVSFPSAQVSTAYNDVDQSGFQTSPERMVDTRCKDALPESFILSAGHLETHKNYPKLIEATARIRGRGREHQFRHPCRPSGAAL